MKVLFVSATLPPEGMATAGIVGNLMLEMKKMGVYVDGLTFKNSFIKSVSLSKGKKCRFIKH